MAKPNPRKMNFKDRIYFYFEDIDTPMGRAFDFFVIALIIITSIITLTTVGFGDIVPVSQLGRAVTILMIVNGLIFIPWQLGHFIRRIILHAYKEHQTY